VLIEVNTQPPLDKLMGGKRVGVEIAAGSSLADLQAHLERHYRVLTNASRPAGMITHGF